jgi:hypothetical protein
MSISRKLAFAAFASALVIATPAASEVFYSIDAEFPLLFSTNGMVLPTSVVSVSG